MKISHLIDDGIPALVVESWRDKFGEELLPIQKRVVKDHDILKGTSFLIVAPTSSGKTFCGELAAAAAIFNRKKVLFLVPLKSIAEERYHDFSAKYRSLGIRLVISTGDRREFDHQIERGNFDLGILIYEKFNQLLVKNIDLLSSVSLIVIDEIQMIAEPERGVTLELALLKVRQSNYRPQIVALSAVLKNATDLADWLGCRLLKDKFRPLELRQGVLTDNRYRYRLFNTPEHGEENLADQISLEPEEALLSNIEHLVGEGEQVLVFLKAKRHCEQLAAMLAERNFWQPAQNTVEQIKREVGSALARKLAETLQSGVAFHHADLSYRQRRILEESYRKGEIKVMVSTTTLAMGVNLPAQSVFIDCYKYLAGKHSGRMMLAPLDWNDYEAMSGRAGRYGSGRDFGRSILIAGSKLEAETMWKNYIEGAPGELASQLHSRPLTDMVLDLISSRVVIQRDQLLPTLQKSYYAYRGGAFAVEEVAEILARLERLKLISVKDNPSGLSPAAAGSEPDLRGFDERQEIAASPIGRLLSLRGVSVASGMCIVDFCRRFRSFDRLSWLYLVLSLPDASHASIFVDYEEETNGHYRHRLAEYVREGTTIAEELRDLLCDDHVLSDQEKLILKCAFLLLDWTTGRTTADLELRYRVNIGSMLQTSESASWLLDTTAEIAQQLNCPTELTRDLTCLSDTVRRGHSLFDSVLATLDFSTEQRDLVWGLFNAGIVAASDFVANNRQKIAHVIGDDLADELIQKFESINNNHHSSSEAPMPQLKLRGLLRGDRVHINFANTEIDITPKSFNYLFKLTAARFLKSDGWLSKDEIEPGFNQAKNIYRVKQELKRFRTGLEERIENNKTGFYRLNLTPQQIKIDYDSMKSFCDLELAELTKRLEGQPVC